MTEESKKRVLIIDDEQDICQILKEKLNGLGFEVAVAYEGKEGFKKVLTFLPNCVLLDIRMPDGEDGLTFLRHLRSFRDENSTNEEQIRRTPVIMLTGAGDQMRPLFQQEGISDYVEKPFDVEDLKTRIFKVLQV